MDKVYGLTSIVIIAAVGSDSGAGLVGFLTSPRFSASDSNGSEGIHSSQFIADIQDLRLTASPSPLEHILADSIWRTRGWTYQE
jgi:hypothetical protein